jgi:hypothetical protein
MADATLSIETREIGVGESILYTADFSNLLYAATLTGSVTITQVLAATLATSTNLTVGSGTINIGDIDIEGTEIEAGKAIQFRVTAGSGDAENYILYVVCADTLGNTQRLGCQLTVNA